MNYEEMSAFELLFERVKETNYEKKFDALVKKDKTGKHIANAGWAWEKFDFKKGLDALIKIDKTGRFIIPAGRFWKKFDYEKGLEVIIERDKIGENIYHAGKYWPILNYKKARAHLKKISPNLYYKRALEEWPLSADEALKKVSNELLGKKKIKDRKFKL